MNSKYFSNQWIFSPPRIEFDSFKEIWIFFSKYYQIIIIIIILSISLKTYKISMASLLFIYNSYLEKFNENFQYESFAD